MFRSCQIIIRELCSLLKLCYSIHNSIRICKRGVVATNARIISHKTPLKHSDVFRSCQIIIRELCSLLKLCYSIHNSIRICKRGVVATNAHIISHKTPLKHFKILRHVSILSHHHQESKHVGVF